MISTNSQKQLDFVKEKLRLNISHDSIIDLAIILGSGLEFTLPMKSSQILAYSDIPGLPQIGVKGHKGHMVLGEIEVSAKKSLKVLIFAGRFHLYEGYNPEQVQSLIQLIIGLQAKNLLITNAAGGIAENLQVGDLMIINEIKDYQNSGELKSERGLLNCLTKPTLKVDTNLTSFLKSLNSSDEINLKQGIYAAVLGPNFETDAEIQLFRNQECSAVGMSTYLEMKLALEKNLDVAALSIITNSWCQKGQPSHQEVLENSKLAQKKLDAVISKILDDIT